MSNKSQAGDSDNCPLNSGQVKITESKLTDTQVGGVSGGNINQSRRDINHSISNVFNIFSPQENRDVVSLLKKQEEELKEEFKQKIDQLAELISSLKSQLEVQLSLLPLDNKEKLRELIIRIERLTGYGFTLEDIQNDLKFCLEASLWLTENRDRVALYAASKIFSDNITSQEPDLVENGAFDELETRFKEDIKNYISWITTYLQLSRLPEDDFPKEWAYLDLESKVYKKAFSFIVCDLVDPKVSKLSIGAARKLASYVNRFFIDEENLPDLFIDLARKPQ